MINASLSLIVAVDEQNAIGKNQQLLVYLPNDLKHFKQITSGHTVVMGRKTFESLPNGALPNRKNIVLSANPAFAAKGITVCRNLDEALTLCGGETLFIIGGGTVYNEALPYADTLYLTRIHHTFADADTFFPEINPDEWLEVSREEHPADERHPYPYTFITLQRRG